MADDGDKPNWFKSMESVTDIATRFAVQTKHIKPIKYWAHSRESIDEMPDDGKCKHALLLASGGFVRPATCAFVCCLPAGHSLEMESVIVGGVVHKIAPHSFDDLVYIGLPDHEFHRLVRAGKYERLPGETHPIHSYPSRQLRACSCGVQMYEQYHHCEMSGRDMESNGAHKDTKSDPDYSRTDYGYVAKYECGCETTFTIVKEAL